MRKERECGLAGGSAEPFTVCVNFWPPQAVLAIQWLWSLRRLWVAVISPTLTARRPCLFA
jgi:hypothetical protein